MGDFEHPSSHLHFLHDMVRQLIVAIGFELLKDQICSSLGNLIDVLTSKPLGFILASADEAQDNKANDTGGNASHGIRSSSLTGLEDVWGRATLSK